MAGAQALQRVRLERGLAVLGTVGNNAPFLGLLGTVIGVIEAFDHRAPRIVTWITSGRHDHRQRHIVEPAQAEILQLAVGAGDQPLNVVPGRAAGQPLMLE